MNRVALHQTHAKIIWDSLNDMAEVASMDVMGATIGEWAAFNGAGFPEAPLIQEQVRRDAMFWAELASHEERAAYFLASATKLRDDPMTTKQTKIMLAECFKRLSPDDRNNFAEWAGKQP
tara:strand:+ start:468 stop:827 length:360 start_codon:yes stop_codon:yes gene_type:complete